MEELLQREGGEKEADFWGKLQKQKNYSNRKAERSKLIGGKLRKQKNYSNGKVERSKRVGAKVSKTGRLLQEEKRERKRWLKLGKCICIIGLLSKKQGQITTKYDIRSLSENRIGITGEKSCEL